MLLTFLITICVAYLLIKYAQMRLLVTHPVSDFVYFCRDIYELIVHKTYRLCPTGEMIAFTGLFGRGKTLSAVHKVKGLYKAYDGLTVWDRDTKKWVKQHVLVMSNVVINGVNHIPLESVSQIIEQARANCAIDAEQGTRTVILVLIDEASVMLNSRGFKKNFNADFLNVLLTSRHYHMSFFYTSQRFGLTDKLLRDVTQLVYDCRKVWRLQGWYIYDAWELENAGNPEQVQPRRKSGFFVRNSDYAAYDSLAVVDQLVKDFDAGELETDSAAILAKRAPHYAAVVSDTAPAGRVRKLLRSSR